MALPRTLKEVAFGAGLNTKGDDYAQPEQLLDIATNVEFDDVGNLRCRYPFDTVRSSLVGGGTLTNARRLAMLGDELVCFTDKALYSWIPALSAWEYRSEHLAVATDEQTVFATPGDQDYADRAELNGHIVYCWQTSADGARIAVMDKTTGAVVQPPTSISTRPDASFTQPRLVSVGDAVLLLFVKSIVLSTTTVEVARITVGPYTYTASGTPVATFRNAPSSYNYDVCRVPGANRCLVAVNDSVSGGAGGYTITSVDSSFSGAHTNGLVFSSPASSPIAIAVSPDALLCTVVNNPSGRYYADVWNVTAAGVSLTSVQSQVRLDGSYSPAVTGSGQLTAGYRLTQDAGRYRCYAFWSQGESSTLSGGANTFVSSYNWIDSSGTVGTPAMFIGGLGIAARAFARDSHVYIVGTFAGLSFAGTDPSGTFSQLQNTYYLYRDDGYLVAKAVWGGGGGFHLPGWLPNVVADSGNANAFVFMEAIRRIVPVGSNATLPKDLPLNYAERAPREVTFTFDDNRARRCVQFGETLYVLGGLVLQYDGTQLVEVGTTTYPWEVDISTGAAGAIPAGGYSYKCTDRWMNAKGEVDRSTAGTVANYTAPGSTKLVMSTSSLYITRKTGISVEAWRTKVNPSAGAPFFLVTSQDPSVTTGDNPYMVSVPTSAAVVTITDNLTDAQIAVKTANPENVGVLPNIEPPPATIAYTDSQRIYLAGTPGYPNTVYYSKYKQPGLVAAFNDALTFDVPKDGGAITSIGTIDGTLIVWCETATYALAGAGFDDTGGGANFQLARILSKDLGCVGPDACAYFDGGFLVKTGKGWYVLDRALNYDGNYVGAGPAKYDAELVYGMTVLTARHQVRVLTSARILVFDTLVKQWAETSISDGLDLVLWNGTPAYLNTSGVRAELATWDGYTGGDTSLTAMDVEGSWIKFGAMQARAICDGVQLLGEYKQDSRGGDSHVNFVVRVRLAKDYEATAHEVWSYHTDKTWTPPAGKVAGNSLQLKQGPTKRRCEAIKARFTVTAADGVSPLGGPCIAMTSIALPFALEPNAYSALGAAQKQ